jgi:gamma-aminobutyric acid receptor subunit beta
VEGPRLAIPGITYEREFSLEEIWDPRPGILNRRDMEVILPNRVRVDSVGNVTFTQRVHGDFAVPLDLRRFPVDKQVLFVEVVSYRYSPGEVVFTSEDNRNTGVTDFSLSGWYIISEFADVWKEHDDASQLEVAHISWRIDIQRNRSYFRYNLLIPLILIVMMAWSVFWIDPNYLPSQIAVSTSSVFTLIAFRFSMGLFLPKVSYHDAGR